MPLTRLFPGLFNAPGYKAGIEKLAVANPDLVQQKEIAKVQQVWALGSKIAGSASFVVATGGFAILSSAAGKQLKLVCQKLEILRQVMAAHNIPTRDCKVRQQIVPILLALACVGIGGGLLQDIDPESLSNIGTSQVKHVDSTEAIEIDSPNVPAAASETILETDATSDSLAVNPAQTNCWIQSTTLTCSHIEASLRGQDACIFHSLLALRQFKTLPFLAGTRNAAVKYQLEESSRDCIQALGSTFAANKALRCCKDQALESLLPKGLEDWEDSLDAFQTAVDHLNNLLLKWSDQLDKIQAEEDIYENVAFPPELIQDEKILQLYHLTETAAITHYRCIVQDLDTIDLEGTMSDLCDDTDTVSSSSSSLCSSASSASTLADLEELHTAMVNAMDGSATCYGTCARLANLQLMEARLRLEKAILPGKRRRRFKEWHGMLEASLRANVQFELAGKAFSKHMYSVMDANNALANMVTDMGDFEDDEGEEEEAAATTTTTTTRNSLKEEYTVGTYRSRNSRYDSMISRHNWVGSEATSFNEGFAETEQQ